MAGDGARAFVGKWTVDMAQSDSIEPMLKGMGVGWKIRKIVTMLKVVQQIQVNGDELVVSNISKHGQDSTTHVMNAGERVIKTNRGDEVIDNCTFDPKREFPLEIVAVLPSNKGSTVDKRKVLPGGNQFMQHLIYRFPEQANKPDILMKRLFLRVEEEAATKPAAPAAAVGTQSSSNGGGDHASEPHLRHRKSSKTDAHATAAAPPAPSHSVPAAVHSHVAEVATGPSDRRGAPGDACLANSADLWIVALFAMMVFTLVFAGLRLGLVRLEAAWPALGAAGVAFALARILARTEKGAHMALNPHARWAAVAVALLGCTATGFGVLAKSEPRGASQDALRVLFAVVAGAALIFARVTAGPVLTPLGDGPKARWALLSALFIAAAGALALFGPTHPATAATAFALAFANFAVFFESAVGYERFKSARKEASVETRQPTDREGKTLSAKVVGFRVVDDLYAQYKLQVQHEGLTWYVWRRFSQFDSLRHELRRVFGHGVLPQLPSKTWFASLDDDFLEERTAELNEFVQQLLDPATLRSQVFKIAETKKFLGVGQGRGRRRGKAGKAEAAPKQQPAAPSLKATPEETKQLVEVLKRAEDVFDKALSVGEGDGWTFLKKYQGVQCYLKSDGDLTHTKGVGVINAPPLVVAAFMADPTKRRLYDDLFKRDTLVRELDLVQVAEGLGGKPVDVSDVKHVEFKSPFPMAIGARDCVLVSCRIIQADGTVKVLLVSPPDDYSKPTSKYIRAKVFAAGIKLEPNPAKPGTCIMSNVQMMDPNGSIPGWIVKAVAPERCAMSAKVDAALLKLPSLPSPLKVPPVPSREAKAQ